MSLCREENLGSRARQRSLQLGVLLGGIALALGFLVTEAGLAQELGWLIALPIALSSYFVIGGTCGVCMFRLLRRTRETDHGREAILDAQNLRRVRQRALIAIGASIAIAWCFAVLFIASA